MTFSKILTAVVLSASLSSLSAFAQQASAAPLVAQASTSVAALSFDVYVDGTLASSGLSSYSNTDLTFAGKGHHTVTVSKAGTKTPVYSASYFTTVTGQIAHLTIDGNGTLALY